MKRIAVTLMIIFALSIVSVVAQEELTGPGITPDSWLYGLDRAVESLQKAFTFAPEARAKYSLQLAAERLAETKAMVDRGKSDLARQTTRDYENEMNETVSYGKKIADLAKKKEFDALVAEATSIHVDMLERVLEKVPEQAKPAIQRAINASKGGREGSLDSLGETEPEKVAELRFKFAEKRLLKAKEKAEENKTKDVEDLIGEYEEEINKSSYMQKRAEGIGRNITELLELVSNSTSKHLQVLQEVYERVPNATKPIIEKAMNVSAKGQESALEALQKIRPEKAEEIETGIPEDVQKIRERIGRPKNITQTKAKTTK